MITMNRLTGIVKRLLLFTLLCLLSAIPVTAQQKKSMEKPTASGHAPVNGINMYYEIYGNGNIPLVLIHGGGSTIETTFGNILPLLAGYGKLVAVELQAHGRTSDRNAPESFEQDADDVAALLKQLKIDKANFMGFSNGGTTTLQLAIRHPQIVNKIVVIAGAYKRDGFMQGFFEFMPKATLDNMPASLKAAYIKVAPDKNQLQVMFEKDKQRMVNFKDMKDEDLQSIKAPALFIVADHDVITPEHTLAMSRLLPDAKLIILPGVHGECIGEVETAKKGSQQPAVTVMMVKEFLDEKKK